MRSAIEQVMTLASKVLTRADVMEGVADMIPGAGRVLAGL
jgi:urease gamma subunit